MSAYAELSTAVREPMREWWKSTGSWLLVGIIVCFLGDSWLSLYVDFKAVPWTLFRILTTVLWLLWGIATTVALPTVWLLAASRVIDLASSRSLLDTPSQRQALFLFCARQGICPTVLLTVLRFGNHAFHLARDGGMYWWQDALAFLPKTFFFWLGSAPVILVAVTLILATRRYSYGIVLVVAFALKEYAWMMLPYHNPDPYQAPHLWVLKVLLQLCLGLGMVAVIHFNLVEKKREDWLAAFWVLAGAMLASPLLEYFRESSSSWLLYAVQHVVLGLAYLTRPHDLVGTWLAGAIHSASTPYSGSLLAFLAPVVYYLWPIAWTAGVVWWLYWLLGAPWKRIAIPIRSAEASAVAT
jgi:hypothetical protein